MSQAYVAGPAEQIRDTTVGGVLRDAVGAFPDRTALVEGVPGSGRRWSYRELDVLATGTAHALLERFEPGEHVAIWAPNSPDWVVLQFATALAGLVLVTVNPAYRDDEVAYVLQQSGAAGVVYAPAFRGNHLGSAVARVRDRVPALREVLPMGEVGTSGGGSLPEVGPDDPVMIQYTSGTTGFPKGAKLAHRSITNDARLFSQRWGTEPGEVWVNPMPLFHTGGCVMMTLGPVQGFGTQVLMPAFEPDAALALLEQERAANFLAVPTMLIAVLEHPSFDGTDLSDLRRVVSGGAMVPADLVREVQRRMGVTFGIVYGQTECAPVMTQTKPDDSPEDQSLTVGTVLPNVEGCIKDPETGAIVTVDEVGEICTRGFHVMIGYHDMPEATAQTIDADGWLHTGDLGSMDERGYFRVTGRVKDMIIRGGENIYPVEIENRLFEHPDVAEAAVVGLPDERWGEIVAAFVRPAGDALDAATLFAYCREHMAAHKAPRVWVFVDHFPQTPSGKIQKFVLRERFESGDYDAVRV